MSIMKFPGNGESSEDLLKKMQALQADDIKWREGRTSSLVYFAGEEVTKLLADAYSMYIMTNGLSPSSFPSLKKFEAEVVGMTAGILGGDSEVVGNMTSGGTESILMAVKTARDRARSLNPEIKEPEMIIPVTAHPAFGKAAQYLCVKPVRIPVTEDFTVDLEAMKAAINGNTILMVGSAPAYPQGSIDPIKELAAMALENNVLFHVDACLGGFLLPFMKKLGYELREFDFSVPGVTSISADVHKYGFGPRGTSVILYKNKELRKFQYFTFSDWPGGLYASPSMTGSRPGGAIASAWAVMNFLGEEGYLKFADIIMKTTKKMIDGINAIPELKVLGKPDMCVFSFASPELDIYSIGEEMAKEGWGLDRQHIPASLHMMVTPAHEAVADKFLADLRTSVQIVKDNPAPPQGIVAMYGALAKMPDKSMANGFLVGFLDSLTEI